MRAYDRMFLMRIADMRFDRYYDARTQYFKDHPDKDASIVSSLTDEKHPLHKVAFKYYRSYERWAQPLELPARFLQVVI